MPMRPTRDRAGRVSRHTTASDRGQRGPPPSTRTPSPPTTRSTRPYSDDGSQLCTTHGSPAAVNEYESAVGIEPWSRMQPTGREVGEEAVVAELRMPMHEADQRRRRRRRARRRRPATATEPLGGGRSGAAVAPVRWARQDRLDAGSRSPVRRRRLLRMLMMAGPITTTNSAGKMQNTIGMSILTGAFCAFSWASWRRLMRISSDWARSTRPIDTPKVSAWRMASTNERTSGTLVRWSSARMASAAAGTGPDLTEHAGELVGQRRRAPRRSCGRAPARSRGRPRPRW